MLVLTRHQGEKIYIDDVSIEVDRVGSNSIKLILKAPKDVSILRGELVEDADFATEEPPVNDGSPYRL